MIRQSQNNQANDFKFPTQLGDSISCLSVNGNATTPSTILMAGAWDSTLSCFELQRNTMNTNTLQNVVAQGQIRHEAPVLCSEFANDNVTTFSAGCDGQIRMWNVTQGTTTTVIGKHDQPVRALKFIPEKNILITGSWDKSVRVWDCRQPNPVNVFTFPERIYAMDANGSALVIGTADKQFHVYNLANMSSMGSYKSPLQYQLRTIALFNDNNGFAAGCIEGRVAIEYFNELEHKVKQSNMPNSVKLPNQKSFVFKCHRQEQDIYTVNAIHFYKNNALVTAGSDGVFSYWNKDVKQRIGNYEQFKKQCPITCAKFTPMGDMMFYALSYDWSKGVSGNNSSFPNQIMMHPVSEAEMTVKPDASRR